MPAAPRRQRSEASREGQDAEPEISQAATNQIFSAIEDDDEARSTASQYPSTGELLEEVKKIDQARSQRGASNQVAPSTQTATSQSSADTSILHDDSKASEAKKTLPHFDPDAPAPSEEENAEDHQSSYASQREAQELRTQMDSMEVRISQISRNLEAIMLERERLPDHIKQLSRSMNEQMTLMQGKLSAALEVSVEPSAIKSAIEATSEMESDTSKVLSQVEHDLTEAPTTGSLTASKQAISGKAKKTRLVR